MNAYPERRTANRQPQTGNRICSACGAQARRKFAKYCLDCGKSLWEGYQPLDNLKSSYRLQNKDFQPKQSEKIENLFRQERNMALELAWAFLVYSMVPYLGILFTPGAIFMGSVGVINAYRRPDSEDFKSALYNIFLSLLILFIQLSLWWLLYIIPKLGK